MLRFVAGLVLMCVPTLAAVRAADIARQMQEAGLDPDECYRVIEQSYSKEDVRIFFTSGYLIFGRPVNGVRTSAMFTAEVEGGDAEVLLLPPVRSERLSLVNFTDSPNLDEHFRSALLLFTDNSGDELMGQLHSHGSKKAPEMGALLSERWSPFIKNLHSSFQVRQVEDILSGQRSTGLFYMTVTGVKLGNFDVMCDPKAEEDVVVGQVGENNGHNYFNVWTSFNSNSRRKKNMAGPDREFAVENYRIDATVDPQLLVRATTRMEVTPKRKTRAAAFIISSKMRVLDANVDGQPAEVFERESIRSSLIRADDDQEFLVVAASELEAGKPHQFEVRHEGAVISTAGDQVYYVASRATWYPRRGSEFARYDLTFHYPKDLGFVATGDFVEEHIDGDWKVTRRKTDVPIRFAAFNLGNYKSVSITQGPYKIDVYANRALESALKPKPEPPETPSSEGLRRRPSSPIEGLAAAPPNPVGRLEALATDVASAFGFMVSEFGPPPMKTLTVSPIPGGFGQGFPSLLYLSTLAYLDPAQRPKRMRDRFQETFFNDMLDAHEIAHQWWGNLVQGAGYQDAWLMEALANYSALMYLEKKKGPHAVETILDDLRGHLVEKSHTGRPLESAGPITWGYRLSSSQSPDAWHHIIYDKGAWVMHMLRRRMGDDRFLAMLRAMCKRYEYQSISTEQFRQLTAEFMPPNSPDSDLTNFFDTWIYGTGIPAIKMTAVVHGLKVSGTLTQSDVPDDFSTRVPVEVQAGRQRSLFWVMTASDPVPFDMTAKALPVKVTLDSKDALIVVKK